MIAIETSATGDLIPEEVNGDREAAAAVAAAGETGQIEEDHLHLETTEVNYTYFGNTKQILFFCFLISRWS